MIYKIKGKEHFKLINPETNEVEYDFTKEELKEKEGINSYRIASIKRYGTYKGYNVETYFEKDGKSYVSVERRIPRNQPDKPGEIWKEVPDYPHNWCSNMGNFKIVDTDGQEYAPRIILCKNRNGRIYRDVMLVNAGYNVRARTSRVILHTFVDPSFTIEAIKGALLVANHKNNNSLDDRLDNLEIVSQKQNITKAIYESGSTTGKKCQKVFAYNIRTNERRDYPSCNQLAIDIFGSHNGGLFDYAYKHQTTSTKGWQVFKDGDSYPRMVKGQFKMYKDLKIFKAGFAYNTKTGKYISSYSTTGNILVHIPGTGLVPLGKIVAALFNRPDLIDDLDSSTRLFYKDKDKDNLFAGNLILVKKEHITKDLKEKYKVPSRTSTSKHKRKPRKPLYIVDTAYPGSDYEETTVYDASIKFDTSTSTIAKYAREDKVLNGRYLLTFNELLAMTFDFQ